MMLKRFLLLILILGLGLPYPALAQDAITLPAAEVDLWPEYDRQDVLVIYRLTLPPNLSLPVDLSIPIPVEAGQPNAVAARQPDGSLFDLPHEQIVAGDSILVQFKATTLEVQLEYYDTRLQKNGDQRQFEYTWPGFYAVDSMTVQVQQPVGVEAMQISPSLGSGAAAQDKLVYYTANIGSLSTGQKFTIEFQYRKSTDELSAASLPVQPSAPINNNTAGRMKLESALPWLLGGLGLLLIVGGGVWYWQSGQERDTTPSRRTRRRAPNTAKAEVRPSEQYIYCHQCGKRAGPGDRFCRTCGAQLRTG